MPAIFPNGRQAIIKILIFYLYPTELLDFYDLCIKFFIFYDAISGADPEFLCGGCPHA